MASRVYSEQRRREATAASSRPSPPGSRGPRACPARAASDGRGGHAPALRQSPSASAQLGEGGRRRGRRRADEVGRVRTHRGRSSASAGAQTAADPVARHGVADAPARRRSRPAAPVRRGDPPDPDGVATAHAGACQESEGATVADAEDQAERRARPRVRRALSTARPARRAHPGHGIRASSCASGCSAGRSASRMASSRGEWAPATPGEGGPGLVNGATARRVYWRNASARNARPCAAARATPSAPEACRAGPGPRVDNRATRRSDTQRANGGRLPHDPRARVAGLGTTPPSGRNYSRGTRDCSLESRGVGCYVRRPVRSPTASIGGR